MSKLSDFATPLAAKNNFIKASFGGFAGSGKSRTASEFIRGTYKHLKCDKPVLFIDNEKGSRFLVPFFKESNIETYVKDTVHLADVLEAFKLLESGEISFLFIDSLTKVWYQYVEDYKAKQRKQFMTLQDWGKILPSWQKAFSDVFVAVEGNCIFTGRGGNTYDMEEDEQGKKQFVKSGVKMKMAGETPFEPDLNIWMDIAQKLDSDGKPVIWREALILKDRSGLIDGKTFKNPTYDDFEPVVKYLLDVPKGDVAGASDTSNIAPKENATYYEQKENREIENEKIKAAFELCKFGTSAEDKKNKNLINQKIFGTTSLTEFNKITLDELTYKRTLLQELLFDYDSAEDKEKYIEEWKPAPRDNELNFDQDEKK
jgi:hypothetical protein